MSFGFILYLFVCYLSLSTFINRPKLSNLFRLDIIFIKKKRENDKNDYILSFFLCFLSNFALQNQAITIMAVLLSCCTAWFEHINIGEEQVTIIIK